MRHRVVGTTLVALALVVAGAARWSAADQAARPPVAAEPPAPTAELTDRAWLYELMRYLYRWHLDEEHIDVVARAGTVTFWVREVPHDLDEGDLSRFGDVLLPQVAVLVHVKKSDYTVPELELTVKSDRFKVVRVGNVEVPPTMPAGYTEIVADYAHLRDELFRTRAQSAFPDGALLDHLREAAREAISRAYARSGENMPTGPQTVYLAPLPPVANEAWAYWETGKTLIRFSSDAELTNPGVWKHHDLVVDIYPLDKNVVVSLDEIAGSNAFMTRDQAGRALFNCMVLGKRVELVPRATNDAAAPPSAPDPTRPARSDR